MKHVSIRPLVAATAAVAALTAVAPATAQASTPAFAAAVAPVNGSFVPLSPARVLDTRSGTGGVPKHTVAAHGTLTFAIAGHGGVPASGVSAVVLNVTVLNSTRGGYITVFPGGTTRPLASNLNFQASQTVANLVTVQPGGTGNLSLYNGASSAVNLLADVAGYYVGGSVTDAGAFVALPPTRVLDTRNGTGITSAHKIAAGGRLTLQVSGQGGVPASGAKAVVMNVTATGATKSGYITVYPQGAAKPTASNLNFTAGRSVPNLVTVGLGVVTGQVTFFNGSTGPVDLIADVGGYYRQGTGVAQGTFNAVQPARLLDTRVAGLGTPHSTPVPGRMNVGLQTVGSANIPLDGVAAVVMNLTSTGATSTGYVTAYPSDPSRPGVSNLNHSAHQTIANLAIVQPGFCGQTTIYNGSNGSTHLLADVSGYFVGKVKGTPAGLNGYAVGTNTGGELADGTRTSTKTPVKAMFMHDLAQVDGDGLGVTHDGGVWQWGPEALASLSGGASTDRGFGNCSIPEHITGFQGRNLVAVAGSPTNGYALDDAQQVWTWGFNDEGQLGHTGAADFDPQQAGITAGHKIVEITAGFALEDNGDVWGWGDNSQGQLGTGVSASFQSLPTKVAGLSGVTHIAQRGDTEYALMGDGSVMAWGSNLDGALGNNSSVTKSSTPVAVAGFGGTGTLSGVTAIAGGMALLSDHTVVSWGNNDHGRLGNSTVGPASKFPVAVSDAGGTLPPITAIAAGADHSVALGNDGSVWAWGAAIVNGTSAQTGTPTQLAGLPSGGAAGIGAGIDTTFVIQ